MKYFAAAFGVIVLVFVIILMIFRGDDSPSTPRVEPTQLVSFAAQNSTVSVTTIGRLVGDENHREIRISVSRNERRLEVLAGYNKGIIQSQTYANTQAGYETFLSALGTHGFLSSKKSSLDQRGICPTGQRYVYDLSVNGSQESNLWANSCDKLGTFNGRGETIRNLFQHQIPDYNKQVQSVKL